MDWNWINECDGDVTTVSRFSLIVGFLLRKVEWVAVWQSTADYSQRNDFMGSVRTARRAGIKHAAIATSTSAEATLT
jgi:hypothetical protein